MSYDDSAYNRFCDAVFAAKREMAEIEAGNRKSEAEVMAMVARIFAEDAAKRNGR